ncbi:MAG: RecQ family ATP-dependent DNA helicase [Bacteroidetes bacterium]|jgi:ATP-dependent DNA helicase RecQ|nr:RecQ family ATP-dependent DNA helicase [Bacteroidota bacterium]
MEPKEILKQYWGYSSFRPLQEDIVNAALDGHDTFALLPTGGGKSITFQVPGLMKDGVCLVITPLIALMKDQVENLTRRKIKAKALHAGISGNEVKTIINQCLYGDIKFLYIAPERIQSRLFLEKLPEMPVSLLAVDEAHCISQWGYDFRPSYLQIPTIREFHPQVPIIALTATATRDVTDDTIKQLKLRNTKVFRKSFERKNLTYYVRESENKINDLIKLCKNMSGTGIIYARNRKKTSELAKLLRQHELKADYYHAGLDHETRSEKQEKWRTNRIRIMVATNAFGMGIDKPDVRFVIHIDLPDSLEEYFQEAGRAGRDEKKSFAVLLFDKNDQGVIQKRIANNFPETEIIRKIYQALGNYFQIPLGAGKGSAYDFELMEFAKTYKFSALQVFASLKILQQSGYIEYTEDVNIPSKVLFILNRDDLYKFQVENAAFDGFIKLLLRSYTGLFSEFTPVQEKVLAKRANISADEVYKYLVKLSKMNVINYIPRRSNPLIVYIEERLDDKNLRIPKAIYKTRKEEYIRQLESVYNYASSVKKCRSVVLLEYFNEKDPPACGQCDVCQEKHVPRISQMEFDLISKEINNLTRNQSVPLLQLYDQIKYPQEKIAKTVQWLFDNHVLLQHEDGMVIWNPKQ